MLNIWGRISLHQRAQGRAGRAGLLACRSSASTPAATSASSRRPIPGEEPERAGAPAGRRRLHAVGIERDRALPVRAACARQLYPEDLRARFDAERWMDWQQTTLNPAGRNAFMQLVRTPAGAAQPAADRASIAATEPLLRPAGRASGAARLHGRRRASPWPTSRSPARSTAGWRPAAGACAARRTWTAGTRHVARPAARGVLDMPLT